MNTPDDHDVSSIQFERLTFFSDAVFAIAITLLVLDLRLPAGQGALMDLSPMVPKLVGFCISFAVIGIYWNAHHRLFGTLQREDGRLRAVNLLFLGSVVFLPFPTSVIAENSPTARPLIFYALSTALVGVLLLLLTWVARRPRLMRPGETPGGTYRLILLGVPAPAIFLGSIGIAQRWPTWTLISWCIIWPLATVVDVFARKLERRTDGAA
jgi:uncharacterized membrane protein